MAGPFEGVKILELSLYLAGPFGSLILSDLGAEIIKIEDPGLDFKSMGLAPESWKSMRACLERGKKSIFLNLRKDQGREVFYDLVRKSDVVFDSFRPGVTERLGIDYDTLKLINPRIICCSLTGFGHTGPYRNRPAFDIIAQALAGIISVTGEIGKPPSRCGIPIGDLCPGMWAALGTMAALYQRDHTGVGQRVETAQLSGMVALLSYYIGNYSTGGVIQQPVGCRSSSTWENLPTNPLNNAYKTKDGDYIIVTGGRGRLWDTFCSIPGMEPLAANPRLKDFHSRQKNYKVLQAHVKKVFLTKGTEEWLRLLEEHDVPFAPINSIDKVVRDPQVLSQDMIVTIDQPGIGEMQVAGNPIKMSEIQEEMFKPAPESGQNTEEILSQLLGYPQQRIDELMKEKVI
ncbi:CaiB/BaiF CoA transferase family protein [Chloroflexota bacterium]